MDEFPMVDVLKVRALDEFNLWLRFSDGCEGVRDLSDLVKKAVRWLNRCGGRILCARIRGNGRPTWPNGFDLDPINLHMNMRKRGDLRHVAAARADDPDPLSHAGEGRPRLET